MVNAFSVMTSNKDEDLLQSEWKFRAILGLNSKKADRANDDNYLADYSYGFGDD